MIFHGYACKIFVIFIMFTVLRVLPRVLRADDAFDHYTNTWAVHIPNVGQEKVNEIARRHGMINLGQVRIEPQKSVQCIKLTD